MEWSPDSAVGDIELLRKIGAIEHHCVSAALPFDDIAAVAGIPLKGVIARAEEDRVAAGFTRNEVAFRSAGQDVVSNAAEDTRGGHNAVGLIQRESVVATSACDHDRARVGNRCTRIS